MSAENIKVYIIFKIDNMHVLYIKNPKNRLYKVNFRSKKRLVIPEAHSYFKEIFKEE